MNFYETSFLFFAFLAALLGFFFLIRNRGDVVANRLLGAYLILFAFNLAFNTLFWSKLLYTEAFIHFFGLNAIPWLCYGPIFYLYQKRVGTRERLNWLSLPHFIPVLIYIISKFSFYLFDAETKLGTLADGSFRNYGLQTLQMAYFAMLQMAAYGFFILFQARKRAPVMTKDHALWMRFLTIAFFGYLLCFISYFARIELGFYSLFSDYIICYFIVLFIGFVAYFGIVQPQVFEENKPMKKVIPLIKYERTGISDDYSSELRQRLENLMKEEKPYLDSDLRLENLAQMLDIPRHHASQVINTHFKANFFDFVNGYRVREAEMALKTKNSALTIQKIAYQSGFNNRASFYKAFKKVNGITPTEYRNTNLAS